MPPNKIAMGTPILLTRKVPINSTIAVVATPIAAEPAANPEIPIARPTAIVEIGEMIINENKTAINTPIKTGCKVVKVFTKLPIANVILLT